MIDDLREDGIAPEIAEPAKREAPELDRPNPLPLAIVAPLRERGEVRVIREPCHAEKIGAGVLVVEVALEGSRLQRSSYIGTFF